MLSMLIDTTDDNAYWYGGCNDSSTSEASSVDEYNDSITSVASDNTNVMMVKERQRLNLTDEPKVSLFIEA